MSDVRADDAPSRSPNAYRLPQLDYRLGVQGQFHDWMLGRLRTGGGAGPAAEPRAPALDAGDSSGFVHALVSAWAAVGDNLSFYQDRIAQEGFLRTATEAFSVRALTAGLGYAPRAATSATTHLAFTFAKGRDGDAAAPLTAPKGVAVQSVAPGAAGPVVFETDEDLVGRADWNALAAAPPAEADGSAALLATAVKVRGGGKLKPGMALVVVDPSPPAEPPQVRLLSHVEARPDGTAWLGWDEPLARRGAAPRLWVCARTARLLGADARPWADAPDTVKARTATRSGAVRLSADGGASWADAACGLPPGELRAAAQTPDGTLYVAVEDTVLRRTGEGWARCGAPSAQSAVTVLRAGPHGRLYAGVARGEVLFSIDEGRSWSPAATAPTGPPDAHVQPRLPPLPVEDLLFHGGRHGGLVVATLAGVWRLRAAGGWSPWSDGMAPAAGEEGPVGVRALAHHRDTVVAATEAGLFHAASPGSRWALAAAGEATALASLAEDGQLVAATRAGLKLSSDGRRWRALAGSPGGRALDRVAATGGALLAAGAAGWSRSDDLGGRWTAGGDRPVALLAEVAPGVVLVAERFTGYAERDWPGLVQRPEAADGWVDLDRAATGLEPGAWVVVEDGDRLTAARVREVEQVARNAFGRSGRVTRVRLDGAPGALDARSVRLHLDGAPVTAVTGPSSVLHRFDGAELRIAGAHPDLAGRTLAVTGRRPRLRFRNGEGGVRAWSPETGWGAPQLRGRDVRLIEPTPAWGLACAADADVFTTDGAPFGATPLGGEATALAVFHDALLAAGDWGVKRAARGGVWADFGPAGVAVRALAVDGDGVAAGSSSGLHVRDGAEGWALADGAAGLDVTAVAPWRGGWLAATASGAIHHVTDETVQVRPADGRRVNRLRVVGDRVHAATDAGVLRWDGRARWSLLDRAGEPAAADALAFDGEGRLWTRRRDGDLHRDGRPVEAFAGEVLSLTVDGAGAVHVGAGRATVLRPLAAASGAPIVEPSELGVVRGLRTALPVQAAGAAPDAVKRALQPLGIEAAEASDIFLEADGLWTLEVRGGRAWLEATDRDDVRVTFARDLELVSGAPGEGMVTLRSAAGLAYGASAPGAELLSSDPKGVSVAEIAHVLTATPAPDGLSTLLTASAPLARTYDAASVTVNANVARASHGETPTFGEVLGGGDNGVADQVFALKRGRPSAPAGASNRHGERASHRLEVRVRDPAAADPLSLSAQMRPKALASAGQLWSEVDGFDRSGPLDPHYRVAETADGGLSVVFGDGERGRRLPSGADNVTAVYRLGAGEAGNVEAGALTLLKRRPGSIRSVTNPLAAAGGVEAEDPRQSRWTAPARARALGRLVSRRDFEGVCLGRPDVGKALAVDRAEAGGKPGVLLTVAGARDVNAAAGAPPGAVDLDALRADLRALGVRRPPVTVLEARIVAFDVAVSVEACAGVVDLAALRAAAKAALRAACAYDGRELGQPVRGAALLAAVQAVPGVASAELAELRRRDAPPVEADGLAAARAVASPGGRQGAELLLLREAVVRVTAARAEGL